MHNYIVSEKDNIVGTFNEKNNAINFLLQLLINRCDLYLKIINNNKIITLPSLDPLKITELNENVVYFIYEYDFENMSLKNLLNNERELLNKELTVKNTFLKKLFNLIKSSKSCNLLKDKNIKNVVIKSNESTSSEVVSTEVVKEVFDLEKFNKEKEEKIVNDRKKEFKRRFESDKKVYIELKNEINEDNIPELFRDQYPIIKVLEKINLLEKDEGFEFYYKKMDSILKSKPNIYGNMFNDSSHFYASKKIEIEDDSDTDSDFEININSDDE